MHVLCTKSVKIKNINKYIRLIHELGQNEGTPAMNAQRIHGFFEMKPHRRRGVYIQ